MRNPQVFQQFQSLQKSQSNPQEFLKEITGNYTPQQKQNFINYAKGFGITDEQLNNYGIKVK